MRSETNFRKEMGERKSMKKRILMLMMVLCGCMIFAGAAMAQDPVDGDSSDTTEVVPGELETPRASTNKGSGGFLSVVLKSGAMGIILWLSLFGAAGAGVYFAVDCGITVRAERIMPVALVSNVTDAMAEGDVLKALKYCEDEPGPLSSVLTAGFSQVEEGFEVIQEAVTTAADLETERIIQKLTWLAVVGNLAPMLGLLGTVQGMIGAFSELAGGAPDIGALAQQISQALYTTAAGLTIAVPCVAAFYAFRNTANTIVLRMEAMTMELIKDLRNVEVVEE
jgi:biopolymer transport protein ExbB